MTTAYPGAIDNLTNPTPSDTLNSATVPHAAQHANLNDAMEAVQNTLGTNPQGTSATVKDRIIAAEGAIINLNLAVDERVPGESGSNAPTAPLPNGYVWVNTSTNAVQVWNGSQFVDPSNAGGASGPWTPYTVNLTNVTLGTGGSVSGYWTQNGKVVHGRVKVTLGTGGSFGSGNFTATLPVTGATTMYGSSLIGEAYLEDAGVLGYFGLIRYVNTTTFSVMVPTAPAALAFVQASTPFAWAVNDFLIANFTYEAA